MTASATDGLVRAVLGVARALGPGGDERDARARAQALVELVTERLRAAHRTSLAAAEAHLAIIPMIDGLITIGARAPEVLEMYRLTARQGRRTAGELEDVDALCSVVPELVALAGELGLETRELERARGELAALLARAGPQTMREYAEELDDIVAASLAAIEQGGEHLTPHEDVVARFRSQ